jgi:hypothetical protein
MSVSARAFALQCLHFHIGLCVKCKLVTAAPESVYQKFHAIGLSCEGPRTAFV